MRKEIIDFIDYCRFIVKDIKVNRSIWISFLMYYSEFESVSKTSTSISYNNYFIINGIPINSAVLASSKSPLFSKLGSDTTNLEPRYKSIIDACHNTMLMIYNKFDYDGLNSYIVNICNIIGQPVVKPTHMLYYATIALDKQYRNKAKRLFEEEAERRLSLYRTIVYNDDVDGYIEINSTKYAAE